MAKQRKLRKDAVPIPAYANGILGQMTDLEASVRLGISRELAVVWRKRLGIKPYGLARTIADRAAQRRKIAEFVVLTGSLRMAAQKFKISIQRVSAIARQFLGRR